MVRGDVQGRGGRGGRGFSENATAGLPPHAGAVSTPRILVASDGREESDALVELAGELAQAQAAGVTLLHVLGRKSQVRSARIQRQAQELELLLDGNSDARIEQGNPRSLVLEAADEVHASLVVMSSRRLKGLHAVGSVSRRVVHQAHCPVLLVPPEGLHAGNAPARSTA